MPGQFVLQGITRFARYYQFSQFSSVFPAKTKSTRKKVYSMLAKTYLWKSRKIRYSLPLSFFLTFFHENASVFTLFGLPLDFKLSFSARNSVFWSENGVGKKWIMLVILNLSDFPKKSEKTDFFNKLP